MFEIIDIFSNESLNPIWTLKTGSLFLLTVDSKKLFLEEGLNFMVKDHDQFGKDEVLGIVNVEPRHLYLAQGERVPFKLHPPNGSKQAEVPGYLVIRCRRASDYDQKFMADFEKFRGKKGVASHDHPTSTTNIIKTMVTFKTKRDHDGTLKVSDKEFPCNTWMSVLLRSRVFGFLVLCCCHVLTSLRATYLNSTRFDPVQTPNEWEKQSG
jgi:hypothetical protein